MRAFGTPRRVATDLELSSPTTPSYIDNSNYKDALALITSLLRELKKLDDKMVLTEVHLLESRVNYALANMPKAKVRTVDDDMPSKLQSSHLTHCVGRFDISANSCQLDILPASAASSA